MQTPSQGNNVTLLAPDVAFSALSSKSPASQLLAPPGNIVFPSISWFGVTGINVTFTATQPPGSGPIIPSPRIWPSSPPPLPPPIATPPPKASPGDIGPDATKVIAYQAFTSLHSWLSFGEHLPHQQTPCRRHAYVLPQIGIVIGCVVGVSLLVGVSAGLFWMWFYNKRKAEKAAAAAQNAEEKAMVRIWMCTSCICLLGPRRLQILVNTLSLHF